MAPPKTATGRVVHLDMVRGLAAMLVFWSHLRDYFFVDYGSLKSQNLFIEIFNFLAKLGHEAVVIFFVLSGFFVAGSVTRAYREERWSWRSYLIHRITRLYVVLIPALVLGVLWDGIDIACFGTHVLQSSGSPFANGARQGLLSVEHLSMSTFLGNALFLQGIAFPTFGSNTPLWSLSYEFWYYLIFPALFCAVFSRMPFAKRFTCLLAGLTVLCFVGRPIAIYFVVWMMGAVMGASPLLMPNPNRLKLLALGALSNFLAAVLLVNTNLSRWPQFAQDLLLGFAFTALIYVVLHLKPCNEQTLYARTAMGLADFSYTLYLVHVPFLVFLRNWWLPNGLWQMDALNAAAAVGIFFLVLLYAWGVARLTEAKTAEVRQAVNLQLAQLVQRPSTRKL